MVSNARHLDFPLKRNLTRCFGRNKQSDGERAARLFQSVALFANGPANGGVRSLDFEAKSALVSLRPESRISSKGN
jgi:hypothetical protein